MSTVEERLTAMLTTHAPLTALVGQGVYQDRADPEAPAPFVVLSRASTAAQHTLCAEVDNPDVQFDVHVWAATRQQAEAVADAVKDAVRAGGGVCTGREGGYSDEVALHATMLKVVVD